VSWGPLSRFLSPRILFADRLRYATPGLLGLEFEEVEFPGPGNVALRGWMIPGEGPGTMVFCPGNSGNLSSHVLYLGLAHRAGLTVLGFDYRGFGRSDGRADLRFLSADVLAACRWVRARRGPGEPLALFGVSLGALAALAAAATGNGEDGGAPLIGAVAAEGLSDVRDMFEGLFHSGSFGPVRIRSITGPDGVARERRRLPIVKRRPPPFLAGPLAALFSGGYPFEGKRPRLLAPRLGKIPVFLIHGVEDEVLPFEAALDVHAALRGPRKLWLVPGAGHAQEPALSHGAEYSAQLRAFFGPSQAGGSSGARLISRLRGEVLEQSVEDAKERRRSAGARADQELEIETSTLGGDGFPRPGLDPVSDLYRGGGYRELFRRMVRSVNGMDFAGLDAALGDYLELRRELPFDLLAAMYCLRIAQAGLGRAPGWPRADREMIARSLERFRALWEAHPALPGRDVPDSPLAWAELV
jgi:uncharacterized protein